MIKIDKVSFEYDSKEVLKDVTFTINEGERIGLVGPNGAGKSTLLKIIAETLMPSSGQIIKSADTHIGYLPQEIISEWYEFSVIEYLKRVTGVTAAEKKFEDVAASMRGDKEALNQLQQAMETVEKIGAYTFDERLKKILAKVMLKQNIRTQKVGSLSGGQKTRLSLMATLLSKNDLLLLDEPTNNLDLEGISILENFLSGGKGAYIVVSHDRRFLRKIATKIVSMEPHLAGIEIFSLGYDEFVEARKRKLQNIAQKYELYKEEKKRLEKVYQAKIRDARNAAFNKDHSDSEKISRNAAKEKAVGAHAAAAKSIASRLEQLKEKPKPPKDIDLNFSFKDSDIPTGSMVVKVSKAEKNFGNDKIIGPFDLTIENGEKIIITGPNGSGKTTLLKLIAGLYKPTNGVVALGRSTKISFIDQDQTLPLPNESLLNNAKKLITSNGFNLAENEIRKILAKFNFGADDINKKAATLSPGERSKVLLAALVAKGTNTLLLDEPTNHLDINATEELEKTLEAYKGTYIIISHDREFVDKIRPTKKFKVINGRID